MPRQSATHDAQILSSIPDFRSQFMQAFDQTVPYDNIIDFATHKNFCNKKLYPKQQTLLKLIYLETENMTAYDVDVIDDWRRTFAIKSEPYGVQEDIWERIEYLKTRGYRRFPHIEAVIGRRGSKGVIGGILGAEQLAYMMALDNWQAYYGIEEGKDAYLSVIATSLSQAKKFQFADIRKTVEDCAFLAQHISTSSEFYLSLRTAADLRRFAEMKAKKIPIEHEIATLRCLAMSSTSASGRGGVGMANFFDEFAFLISGSGSVKSSEEIYCLDPNTRILCADLVWRLIKDIQIGDKVIGIDETNEPGQRRKLRESTIERKWSQIGKALRLHFSDGTSVVCSPNHRWFKVGLHQGGSEGHEQGSPNSGRWASVELTKRIGKYGNPRPLKVGDYIRHFIDPWESDDTREGGYFAGLYDGEGCVSSPERGARRIHFGQNRGPILDHMFAMLKEYGFEYTQHAAGIHGADSNCIQITVTGLAECLRLLGTYRPERLLADSKKLWNNRIMNGSGVKQIVEIEELPEQELVDIQTSTHTFIAEGLVSHNSAYQPALDDFGKDSLTFVPSSPYTKIGKFYELYRHGSVLIPEYLSKMGKLDTQKNRDELADEIEEEAVDYAADPEMLVVQLSSWSLYEDFERGQELVGVNFKRAIQVYDDRLKRLERRDPEKFKVERKSQFADVQNAYLDPAKVDQMFEPFWAGRTVNQQDRGTVAYIYEGHADPSRTNANFAVCIAHLERSPELDEYGHAWDHVIVDHLHVWKPEDYHDHIVNYVQVQKDLEILIANFPALRVFSFDAWNSAGFIAMLKERFKNKPRIIMEPFNDKVNQDRAEYFKSAMNLGWVHSYKDTFFNDGQSLLETELKFLTEVNGKVQKQTIGPCTTKDLADTLMTCVHRLLHAQLDQWQKQLLGKMPMSKGLPGGKLFDDSMHGSRLLSRHFTKFERGTARSNMQGIRDSRVDGRRRHGR